METSGPGEAPMRLKNYTVAILSSLLFLTGCAAVRTVEEWNRVQTFAKEQTGVKMGWVKSEEENRAIQSEVKKLLSDGLSMDEAVRIALLNNPKLQAFLEELGIAKAELVQAGLLTNPTLSGLIRFPFGGGKSEIEADGLINIADLWQIPFKKKSAEIRLEATILRTCDEILNTISEAKHAYVDFVSLFRILDEVKKTKKEVEDWRGHLLYRQKFGFTSDLEIFAADVAVIDNTLDLAMTERDLRSSRLRLNRVLGLVRERPEYEISVGISEDIKPLPDLDVLINFAISKRPDMQIAKLKVEDLKRVLALERKRIFSNLETGVSYAREADGKSFWGPMVEIQLPIFDQNQAQIAKAEYTLRRAEKEVGAKSENILEEVSDAFERLLFVTKELALIRDRMIPVRKNAVNFSEKYFHAMQLNMVYLLESRQKFLEANRRYFETLREYHHRIIGLERVLGGVLPIAAMEWKDDPKHHGGH
jgi:cobalt-zinc-cadmium efflux system outer membrane protein